MTIARPARSRYLRGSAGAFLALAACLAAPDAARAGDDAPSLAEPGAVNAEELTGCYPQCRGGFYCLNGKCISPCNPPCQTGDICTRGGRCIPEKPSPPLAQPPPPPAVDENRAAEAEAERRRNAEHYRIALSKRNTGIGILVPGAAMIAAAVALGAVSGAEGRSDLMIAAITVELAGDALFIPGLILAIQGQKAIEESRSDLSKPGSPLAGARFRFAGASLLASPLDGLEPRGAVLRFTF